MYNPVITNSLQRDCYEYMYWSLKALCHTIEADCLLMSPHAPTRQMKTGCGRWLISSCVDSQICPLRLSSSMFNVSSIVCALEPLLTSILTLWLSIADDCELLKLIVDKIFVLYACDLRILPCTMLQYWACPCILYPRQLKFWTNELIKKQLCLTCISWHDGFNT